MSSLQWLHNKYFSFFKILQKNNDTSEKPSTSDVKCEPKKEKVNKLNFTAVPKSKSEEKTDNKSEDQSPKKLPAITEPDLKVN